MEKPSRTPSILVCAIGFSFAGCGLGVFPGIFLSKLFQKAILGENPQEHAELKYQILSIYLACFLSMLGGCILGVRYAWRKTY